MTGQYVVTFDPTTLKSSPQIEDVKDKEGKKDTSLSNTAVGRELTTSGPARPLTLQERAITLATAISADFGEQNLYPLSMRFSLLIFFDRLLQQTLSEPCRRLYPLLLDGRWEW